MLASYLPPGDIDTDERDDFAGSLISVLRSYSSALSYTLYTLIALPLLILFVIKIGMLVLYVNNLSGAIAGFWALFVRGMSGDALLHYPVHLLLMKKILGRIDLIIELFVQVIFVGATIHFAAALYRRKTTNLKKAFTAARIRYFDLVAVAFVSAIVMIIMVNIPGLADPLVGGIPSYIVTTVSLLLGMTVQALFVFAPVLIMVEDRSPWSAIGGSMKMALRHPGKTFLLVLLPFAMTIPTFLLSLNSELIAFRIAPEFMIHIQSASELMHLISNFLLVGGATIIYIRLNTKKLI